MRKESIILCGNHLQNFDDGILPQTTEVFYFTLVFMEISKEIYPVLLTKRM